MIHVWRKQSSSHTQKETYPRYGGVYDGNIQQYWVGGEAGGELVLPAFYLLFPIDINHTH